MFVYQAIQFVFAADLGRQQSFCGLGNKLGHIS